MGGLNPNKMPDAPWQNPRQKVQEYKNPGSTNALAGKYMPFGQDYQMNKPPSHADIANADLEDHIAYIKSLGGGNKRKRTIAGGHL